MVSSAPSVMKALVYFSVLATGLAVRTPSISWITKEQVVDIGSSVQLECSVQYAQDYPVLWVKKGSGNYQDLPISSGPALILRESRYSLRHDKGSATYILQIKDIQESDGGDYMCQVLISLNNRITANVNLLVRRPPVISDNSTRSVVASEGDSVELSCYAGGMPIPDISWRKENNAILPTGGSIYRGNVLQIANIRKEDRGTYYCIAENQVGRGARRNINVEVEFAPVVKAIRPRVYQALQYDADMQCHVEAYPPAAITWVHQQEAIVNNQHYSVSQFATADEFTDTTLRVQSIEKRQFGNYSCMATNKLGQSSATITLEETSEVPPSIEWITRNKTVESGSSVQIVCFVRFPSNYPVLWSRRSDGDSQDIHITSGPSVIIRDPRFTVSISEDNDNFTLKIVDVGVRDAGWYSCQVLLRPDVNITSTMYLQVRDSHNLTRNTPEITFISRDQESYVRTKVQLECSVRSLRHQPVLWVKKNSCDSQDMVISIGQVLYRKASRYSLSHVQENDTYVLEIDNVHLSDDGDYMCQVLLSPDTNITATVHLGVRLIPRSSFRSVLALEGEDVALYCYLGSNPIPDMFWEKDSNAFFYNGSSPYRDYILPLPNITRDDAGLYQCLVGQHPAHWRNFITVTVQFPPTVEAIRPRMYQALEHNAILSCYVEGYPVPNITWIFHDRVIENDKQHSVIQHLIQKDALETTLRVDNLTENDFGNYTCQAANKLGTTSSTIVLIETTMPVCSPSC